MLQAGSIRNALRAGLLLCLAAALAGCSASPVRGSGSVKEGAAVSPALQARYDDALVLLRAGDPAAPAALERLAGEQPQFAGPLFNLARVRALEGDETAARDLLQQAALVCTRCGPVWNELGILERQQGHFAAAEQAYQQAIASEPAYGLAHYNIAVLYELYLQRPELALAHYERYRALDASGPDSGQVDQWIADLQRRVAASATTARAEGVP